MDDKQIRLINWLYNFAVVEMKAQPDKFLPSDETQLQDAIKRRFPDLHADITKPFELVRKEL